MRPGECPPPHQPSPFGSASALGAHGLFENQLSGECYRRLRGSGEGAIVSMGLRPRLPAAAASRLHLKRAALGTLLNYWNNFDRPPSNCFCSITSPTCPLQVIPVIQQRPLLPYWFVDTCRGELSSSSYSSRSRTQNLSYNDDFGDDDERTWVRQKASVYHNSGVAGWQTLHVDWGEFSGLIFGWNLIGYATCG